MCRRPGLWRGSVACKEGPAWAVHMGKCDLGDSACCTALAHEGDVAQWCCGSRNREGSPGCCRGKGVAVERIGGGNAAQDEDLGDAQGGWLR